MASGGENPFEAPLSDRSILVVGSEGTGLPAGAYRYLDRKLTIPMKEPVDSLNAAVAAALLLYSGQVVTDRGAGSKKQEVDAGS